jgi:hypothetical protein
MKEPAPKAREAAAQLALARQRRDFARRPPEQEFRKAVEEVQRALEEAVRAVNHSLPPYEIKRIGDAWALIEGQSVLAKLYLNTSNAPELTGQLFVGDGDSDMRLGPYRLQPARQPIGSKTLEWSFESERGYEEQVADHLLVSLITNVATLL